MTNETTHRRDPDTGHMRQLVSPERLREILDGDGDDYSSPSDFGPDDEWDVGDDRVARAAEHLDATDLGNGRWAHYADETSRWYIVTADELAELCDYLDSDDEQVAADAYSHWCAGTSGEEMPAGWAP